MCVAPLVNDAEVRQFLQSAAAAAVTLVEGRFRDGISAGEIPSDFPVATRAIQVTDLVAVKGVSQQILTEIQPTLQS